MLLNLFYDLDKVLNNKMLVQVSAAAAAPKQQQFQAVKTSVAQPIATMAAFLQQHAQEWKTFESKIWKKKTVSNPMKSLESTF